MASIAVDPVVAVDDDAAKVGVDDDVADAEAWERELPEENIAAQGLKVDRLCRNV